MNVIVFAWNGCPVSALGPYGNEWVVTPNLDRLASEAVTFDAHVSDAPDPAAARRAWLSGRHQIPPWGEVLGPPSPGFGGDLLARLRSHGVRTVLVRHTREPNDACPEYYAGWDERFDARPHPTDPSPIDALVRVLPTILDQLAASGPWLLWIEMDALLPPWHITQQVFDLYVEDLVDEVEVKVEHEDKDIEDEDDEAEVEDVEVDEVESTPVPAREPVEPWIEPPVGWFDAGDLASWELLHRSFAAAVSVFDAGFGEVLEVLRARNLDTSAAWVLTADRGYPLGEHGVVGSFRPWLHEELVHTPLIVRLPNAAEAGRRVPAFTQPADLMPTLASWFGADATADHGVSLIPLLQGQAHAVRPYAISGLPGEWAIRTPDWAFLLPDEKPDSDDPRRPMLFEKPGDRWEVNDLTGRHVERCEELETLLRDVITRLQKPGPITWPSLESDGEEAEAAG